MRHFLATMAFLTVLPAGKRQTFEPDKMAAYFPAVGLLLGLLLSLVSAIGHQLWPPMIVALLLTLFLAAATGALHIDGLGDSADGLLSHRSRQRALEIMKDSRLGTMGLVAIFFTLLLKWLAISAVPAPSFLLWIVVPALARGSMLLGIYYLPYARSTQGTGRPFFDRPLNAMDFRWLAATLLLVLLLGQTGIRLLICFAVLNTLLLFYYRNRMGGITGDMLGALVEVNEAFLFLSVAQKTL